MNKERQKQTRALFHLLSVLATDFSQTSTFTFIADIYIYLFHVLDPSLANVPIPYPIKNTREPHVFRHPDGINWEHHQPN